MERGVVILTFMGPCIVRIFQYMSNKMQRYTVYYNWKLLYMFRVPPPPIIRSAYNCIYSIWYLSSNGVTNTVDRVVCDPDDGWRYRPKHVEQFPDTINCVTLHLVGYILECWSKYSYFRVDYDLLHSD